MFETILLERDGGVATISLNRPRALNAFDGRMHEELGVAVREAGIERLFTLGELAARAAQAFGRGADAFQDLDALCAELMPLLSPGTTVLVKGSRFMRMERVVNRLVDGADADEGGR